MNAEKAFFLGKNFDSNGHAYFEFQYPESSNGKISAKIYFDNNETCKRYSIRYYELKYLDTLAVRFDRDQDLKESMGYSCGLIINKNIHYN